jgi:stage III sporulation protein AE
MYRLCAALIQPLGQSQIQNSLQIIGKNTFYIFICLLTVGFVFFFSFAMLIAAGNWSYMFH